MNCSSVNLPYKHPPLHLKNTLFLYEILLLYDGIIFPVCRTLTYLAEGSSRVLGVYMHGGWIIEKERKHQQICPHICRCNLCRVADEQHMCYRTVRYV